MAYSIIIDDNFTRTNTSTGSGTNSTNVTAPGTYNSPSVDGNYVDALGNVWEISSNTLTAINLNRNNDNGDFSSAFLSRPTVENIRDGQAALTFVPGTAGSATCVIGRLVSGVGYGAYVYYSGGTLNMAIAKLGPGSNTQSVLTSDTYSGSGTSSYILTLTANGASPTTLTATLALASAPGTILKTLTTTDSTSALQVAAPWGISCNGASGGTTYTGTITHFTTYQSVSSAANITISPTSSTVPASGTQVFTIGLDGALNSGVNLTVNLATTIGTLSASSLTFTGTGAVPATQTVTLTAPGTAGSGNLTGTHTESGSSQTLNDFASVPVTVTASLASAITISPTSSSISTSGTQTFTIGLNGALTSGISLTVNLATTIGTLSASSLTFTGTGAIPASQTVVLTAPGSTGSGTLTGTHTESGGSQTLADFSSVPVTITAAAGTATAISISPTSSSLSTGGTQTFSVTVNGTLTNGLSLVVNLATTIGSLSSSSLTFTGTGGTPSAQTVVLTAPGTAGSGNLTGMHSESGGSQTLSDFSSVPVTVTVAAGTATAITISPTSTSITPSGTQTFTVGVNGTLTSGLSLVVNLATTIGTLSASSLTFAGTGGTPATQTVTLTAPGSTGSGSLTGTHSESSGSQTLSDFSSVAVTVAASVSLAIGTLAATSSQSGITLSLSAALSGGAGGGYSYAIYRGTDPNFTEGAGTLLATVGGLPYTDTTASPGVQYYYGVQGSDSAAHTVNALPTGLGSWSPGYAPYVTGQLQGTALNIVFVGDSITYGTGVSNPGTVNSPTMPYFCMAKLKRLLGIRSIYGSNNGVSGHTLADWAPGGSDYSTAKAAMNTLISANATALPIFSIMLGTNDSASSGTNNSPSGSATPVVYSTRLQALVTQMLTDFPAGKVFVHLPPWYSPNTQNAANYQQPGLSALANYRAATATVVAGYAATYPGQVFLGDTYAFQYFAQNYQAEQQPDTSGPNGTFYLHPAGTAGSNGLIGTQSLGEMHAQAMAGALLGGIANRWTH